MINNNALRVGGNTGLGQSAPNNNKLKISKNNIHVTDYEITSKTVTNIVQNQGNRTNLINDYMQALDKKIKRVQEAVNKGDRLGANEAESIIKEIAIEYQQISKLKQLKIDEFNTAIAITYSRETRYDYKNTDMPTNDRVGGQANTIITSYLKDAAFYIIRMNAQSLGIDDKTTIAQTVQTIFSQRPTTNALFPNTSNQNRPAANGIKNGPHLSHNETNNMNYNLYPSHYSKNKHLHNANDNEPKTHSTSDKKTNAYYYNTYNSKTKYPYWNHDEYNEQYSSKPKIIRDNEGWFGHKNTKKNLEYCMNETKTFWV